MHNAVRQPKGQHEVELSVVVPEELTPGSASLNISLESDFRLQPLGLAIAGGEDGSYWLGTLDVQ